MHVHTQRLSLLPALSLSLSHTCIQPPTSTFFLTNSHTHSNTRTCTLSQTHTHKQGRVRVHTYTQTPSTHTPSTHALTHTHKDGRSWCAAKSIPRSFLYDQYARKMLLFHTHNGTDLSVPMYFVGEIDAQRLAQIKSSKINLFFL